MRETRRAGPAERQRTPSARGPPELRGRCPPVSAPVPRTPGPPRSRTTARTTDTHRLHQRTNRNHIHKTIAGVSEAPVEPPPFRGIPMNKRESVSPPRFVRETAIVYHHEDAGPVLSAPHVSLFPRFPGSSPGPSGEAAPPPTPIPAPPSDHPPAAASPASGQASTPAPGRVWWYVLYDELSRRDAAIDALAGRVACLERRDGREQRPRWGRRRYYE